MKNETTLFSPTLEEINLIRELADGWENVWSRISVELMGPNEDGLLVQAVRSSSFIPPYLKEEMVSFIIAEYYAEVLAKTRFIRYDPEQGDVYTYLCNPRIIRMMYQRWCKANRREKQVSLNELNNQDEQNNRLIPISTAEDPDEVECKCRFSEPIGDKRFGELNTLCSRLCDEPLTISVEAKIDRNTTYAGLQLYRRLDRSVESIRRLIDHIHQTVQKATQTEPAEQIELEHQKAEARIDAEVVKCANDLAKRGIAYATMCKLQRKLDELDLERYFWPLIAEQIMKLLDVTQTNAHKLRTRYRKELKKILPPCLEDKELLELLNIWYEEEENNDD